MKVSDGFMKVSDGVRKVSEGVRKLSYADDVFFLSFQLDTYNC